MDTSKLKAGDPHYTAFVGPPAQYDFMGATQFRLLCTLGLRDKHKVLDFGCGSLRAGRFLMSYLNPEGYFGIEPNPWLIEDSIKNQVGADFISIKKPSFDNNSEMRTDVFNTRFDFIVAQSIFSHTGKELVKIALSNFRNSLEDNGIAAVTFIHGGKDYEDEGWRYPKCVQYKPQTITKFAADANLFIKEIPWYHPRQSWYLLSKSADRLPNEAALKYLSGAILFDPEFANSCP
jgi:hypothetical protein